MCLFVMPQNTVKLSEFTEEESTPYITLVVAAQHHIQTGPPQMDFPIWYSNILKVIIVLHLHTSVRYMIASFARTIQPPPQIALLV